MRSLISSQITGGGVEGGYYTVRTKSCFVFFAPPSEKITHRVGSIRYLLNIIAIRTELYFLWGGWLKIDQTFFLRIDEHLNERFHAKKLAAMLIDRSIEKLTFYNRVSIGWERFEDLSPKNNEDLAEPLTCTT